MNHDHKGDSEQATWLRALLGAEREAADPTVARSAQLLRAAALRSIRRKASLERSIHEAMGHERDGCTGIETVELLAAAEPGTTQLPRMATAPSRFVISPIYRLGARTDEPPVSLLVECPESLRTVVQGQAVFLLLQDQRIELGRFDIDGKATGPIPPGTELRPPFEFLVDDLEEHLSGEQPT